MIHCFDTQYSFQVLRRTLGTAAVCIAVVLLLWAAFKSFEALIFTLYSLPILFVVLGAVYWLAWYRDGKTQYIISENQIEIRRNNETITIPRQNVSAVSAGSGRVNIYIHDGTVRTLYYVSKPYDFVSCMEELGFRRNDAA